VESLGNRISVDSETIKELRALEDQKSSREDADWLLYQYGQIIGVTNTRGQTCKLIELPQTLAQAAIADGILNVDATVTNDGITIKPYGARSVDDDHFCAGYLAGVVSELLSEGYVANIRGGIFDLTKSTANLERSIKKEKASDDLVVPKLERGESYLIVDEVKNAPSTFNVFQKAVKQGLPGLCITRVFPPRAKEKYAETCTKEYQILWLSTTESSDGVASIKPGRFDHEMSKTIQTFLKDSKGIVMLHGIEFLISNNDFPNILKFTQRIRDAASVSGGIFLIAVDPSTLDVIQYNNLKSEFTVYGE
jgi:hypothetical protein